MFPHNTRMKYDAAVFISCRSYTQQRWDKVNKVIWITLIPPNSWSLQLWKSDIFSGLKKWDLTASQGICFFCAWEGEAFALAGSFSVGMVVVSGLVAF